MNLATQVAVLFSGSAPTWGLTYPANLGAYWDGVGSTFDAAVDAAIGSQSDRSTNGYTATQGTGAQKPTRRADHVEYDGTASNLLADAAAALFTGTDTAYTAIFAVDVDSTTGTRDFLSCDGSATTGFLELRIDGGKYNVFRRDNANASVSVSSVANATTGKQILVFAFSGTTITIRKNATTLVNETAMDLGAITLDTLAIGRRRDVGVNFFDGKKYRTAIYSRRLTDVEIAFVESQWNTALAFY